MTAQEAGLPMTFQRSGSMFCGYFGDHPVRNLSDAMACDRDRFKPYFHAMLENGGMWHPASPVSSQRLTRSKISMPLSSQLERP